MICRVLFLVNMMVSSFTRYHYGHPSFDRQPILGREIEYTMLNSNHLFSCFSKFFAWLRHENQYNYKHRKAIITSFFVSFYKSIIFENVKAMRKILLLFAVFKCAIAGAQNF